MITKKDLLAQFTQATETFTVEAWNNAQVQLRKLTIKEQADINAILFGDITTANVEELSTSISLSAMQDAQILTAHYALVEPKMSVNDINNLPIEALAGIAEIHEALSEWSNPKK